jgi:hypothetical protein
MSESPEMLALIDIRENIKKNLASLQNFFSTNKKKFKELEEKRTNLKQKIKKTK